MINQSIVVRCFQTNHLTEFGAFLCVQSISLLFGQGLGVFVVFSCAFDHLQRHGGVGRVVLVEVEYPLQTGCEVLCITSSFFVAVDVYPFYIVAQFEGPGQTAILGTPFFSDTWNQFTLWVSFQQTVYQVAQVFIVLSSLRVQNVEGFQLTSCNNRTNQIFNLVFRGFFLILCLCFFLLLTALLGGVAAFSRFFFGCCSTAAAAAQHEGCCHSQSKQSGYCLVHIVYFLP